MKRDETRAEESRERMSRVDKKTAEQSRRRKETGKKEKRLERKTAE
jgi:hypothetical protein